MKLDKFLYPASQWFHLMYIDKNPVLDHEECQLCNEPFELFDAIVLPIQCCSREDDKIKPHFFHICCIDIIGVVNDDKEDPQFKLEDEGFQPDINCIVCNVLSENHAHDAKLKYYSQKSDNKSKSHIRDKVIRERSNAFQLT